MKRLIVCTVLLALVSWTSSAQNFILLNEIRMNPPGSATDGPWEYIELVGTPGMDLANHYLVVLDGVSTGDNPAGNPGFVKLAVDLGGRIGTVPASGLIVVKASVGGPTIPASTVVDLEPAMNAADIIPNEAATVLILRVNAGVAGPATGQDYDRGAGTLNNDGTLDQAPFTTAGSVIVDAVAWRRGNSAPAPGDKIYTTIRLNQTTGRPDAATRYSGNRTANSLAAWFSGSLQEDGGAPNAIFYDARAARRSSSNTGNQTFPGGPAYGIFLTPGAPNEPNDANSPNNPTPSTIDVVGPLGVMVPTYGPGPVFTLVVAPAPQWISTVSSDQSIAEDGENISVHLEGGQWHLYLNPYLPGCNIMVTLLPDGDWSRARTFPFASLLPTGNSSYHGGVSDGSTAIPLTGNLMLFGDDERNPIRIYDRTVSGPTLALPLDPSVALNTINAFPPEIDIEASTRIGNVIYWTGSSANGPFDITNPDNTQWDVAEARPNRDRFFATTVTDTGVAGTTVLAFGDTTTNPQSLGYSASIRSALFNWNAARYRLQDSARPGTKTPLVLGVDSKQPYGFNIEGLAASPDNSRLYFGFRAPLVPAPAAPAAIDGPGRGTLALIASLNNFPALLTGSGQNSTAPAFDNNGIELNLGARGIRSIERVANSSSYLIIAGLPTVSDFRPGDFALFIWDGNTVNPTVTELVGDLAGKNPEGIIELMDGWTSPLQRVRLLEDNGTYDWYNAGGHAKDFDYFAAGDYRKSRSDVVTLGPPINGIGFGFWFTVPTDDITYTSQANYEGFAIANTPINNGLDRFGPIVGQTDDYSFVGRVAFVKDDVSNGAIVEMGSLMTPGQDVALSLTRSDYGKAVGYGFHNPGPRLGIMWDVPTRSVERSFGTLGGGWSEARGISSEPVISAWPSSGCHWVVGASEKAGGNLGAWIWFGTCVGNTIFELTGVAGATYTVANAINNFGIVVGASGTSQGTRTACVWGQGTEYGRSPINLGTFAVNGGPSEALAVNNNGTIVGYAYTNGVEHACLWALVGSKYSLYDLGVLVNGGSSEARSINDFGQVVGNATAAGGGIHGVTWLNGKIFDLNNRVTLNGDGTTAYSGTIISANGVNSFGHVTGAWMASPNSPRKAYYLFADLGDG